MRARDRARRRPPTRVSVAPAFRVSAGQRFRIFVLGFVAVAGAVWALQRHLAFVPRPMLEVPPAPTEIPAPDLEP